MQKHPEYDYLVPAGTQPRLLNTVLLSEDELGWEIDELWLWTRVLEGVVKAVGEENALGLTVEPKRVVFTMPAPLFFAWVDYTGGEITESATGRLVWDAGDQVRFAPQAEDESAVHECPTLVAFAVMEDGEAHENCLAVPVEKMVEMWMKEQFGIEPQPMPVPAVPAAQPVNAFGLPMQNPGQVA